MTASDRCQYRYAHSGPCNSTRFEHFHQPVGNGLVCQYGHPEAHHAYQPEPPHEHTYRLVCDWHHAYQPEPPHEHAYRLICACGAHMGQVRLP